MTEVTWSTCHVANLSPSRGRGLKLLGLDLTITNGYTLTTGLDEISGVGYATEDANMDANTNVLACAISGGTITLYGGDFTAYGGMSAEPARLIVMGIRR